MRLLHHIARNMAPGWMAPEHLSTASAPVRPIVIIQSDDWGRVGAPSKLVIDELRQAGLPVGDSPWDYYGLESADDVEQLAAVLAAFRDSDGKAACMTANFVMANADLRQMASEGWQKFCWKPIDEGFPAPWDDKLLSSYRDIVEAKLFYPALHGFTHFNTAGLVAALNDAGDLGHRARALAERDVPYLRSATPEFNFALVKCDAYGEHFLGKAEQAEWLDRGVELFKRTFGCRPTSACAPGYRANEVTLQLFSRADIAIAQGQPVSGDVPVQQNGVLLLARNVSFEPCLNDGDFVNQAIIQASQAVAAGAPIVICSHSINYISRFVGRAEVGRTALAALLTALKARFPNLRFTSDGEFLSAWQGDGQGWFRPPTEGEVAERQRRFWLRQIGALSVAEAEEQQGAPQAPQGNRRGGKSQPAPVSVVSAEANNKLANVTIGTEENAPFEGVVTAARLGGQTFYVFLGAIFTLVVGFPLQIYVSRVLGSDGVGTFGLVEGAVTTVAGFLGLGIAQTLVRFIPFHLARREYGSIHALVRFGALTLLVVGLVSYFVGLASLEWVGKAWPNLASQKDLIALMGILIPLGLILYFLQQGLRAFHDVKYMVTGSSVVQLSVKVVITVAAFALGWGIFGYGVAVVVSTAGSIIWMSVGLLKKIRALPIEPKGDEKDDWSRWRRFAATSYLSNLVSSLSYIDRFLLGFFAGPHAVGIFMIARQLQGLPGMFNQMLLLVGAPMFARAHGQNNADERQHIYSLMTDWVVRASLPLLLFLVILGTPVLGLFGPDFAAGGYWTLVIMVGAQAINLAFGPVGNVVMMSGLEKHGLRANAFATGFGFAALIALVPFLGLVGAALATAFDWIFLNGLLFLVAHRHLGIRWLDRRFLNWFLPALAAIAVAMAARPYAMHIGLIGLAAVLVAMYAAFVLVSLLQGLHEDDKDLLRHMWGKIVYRI